MGAELINMPPPSVAMMDEAARLKGVYTEPELVQLMDLLAERSSLVAGLVKHVEQLEREARCEIDELEFENERLEMEVEVLEEKVKERDEQIAALRLRFGVDDPTGDLFEES